ncbi:uncharacterized protein LOC116349002 [Contarinia nasturtii]|uniref:uncharacterized protein LOC116349002 n=1 Tax=Contarinia nasturtii TaxID=265458 RepID=UPI0012D48F53|nr:uncharacterized protein LOC116349002 [Contarinia nasturtii]XP_031636113.1 uncharacterized protein LOC116349002 [Contarinia nasturtii]
MNFLRKKTRNVDSNRTKSVYDSLKNEMYSSAIFALNVKCLYKLFDWLTLKELNALAGTCKRFNIICGAYFLQNFSPSAVCIDDGIVVYRHRFRGTIFGYKLNAFSKYMEKITIPTGRLSQFRYVEFNCVESLIELCFVDVDLTDVKIKRIKHILGRIETVELIDCHVHVQFYDGFIKYCYKLKRLKLSNVELKYGNDWMLRNFSTLEHLQLIKCKNIKRSELEVLFEMNPNIWSFEIDADLLWENKMVILETGVKWNDLIVHVTHPRNTITISIYSLLNTFHTRGHFKRLHLRCGDMLSQPFIDRIRYLNALETLHVKGEPGCVLSRLYDLKELHTFSGNLNMDESAKNLLSLEKVVFWDTTIEDVVSIIRKSVKLKEIQIRTLKEKGRFSAHFNAKNYFQQGALNLIALNGERKQLSGADTVTIFVSEDIFLATKWTTDETSHGLIELKRIMLHDWNTLFLKL